MRNTKKLIAVIMTIAILASMMVPALAASYQTEAEKLMAVGLMKGTDNGADLEMALDRIQGITFTIRAMGVEEEALAMTEAEIAAALENVTDADTIPAWGRAYAAYAVANGITNGVSATEFVFAPFAKLSGTQFITMMLRALGYTGVTLDNCLEKAIAAGMLTAGKAVEFGTQDQLLRDGAAYIIYSTAKNGLVAEEDGVTPSDMTLIGKLVADGVITATAAATNFDYEAPAPAETTAITFTAVALNAVQFKLTFDQAVNADDAEDTDFYTIDGKEPGDASLNADGSVTLTITNGVDRIGNNSTVDVVLLAGFRNAAGIELGDDYTVAVAVFDTTFPTFDSVEAVGLKTLRLHYSEPVWNGTTIAAILSPDMFEIKTDTYTWYATKATTNVVGQYVEVTVGTNLIEGTINVKSLKDKMQDFAGNIVAEKTISYTFVKDTTAPVASIGSASQTEVVIKFNKPVYGDVKVAHSNKTAYVKLVEKLESDATDEWTFAFPTEMPLPAGNVTIYVYSGDDAVQDLYGNKLVDTVLTTTVTLDITAPTVSSTKVNDDDSFEVTFNEAVWDDADEVGNYVMKKADGTRVYLTSASLDEDKKVLTLTPVAKFSDHTTYTLTIEELEDESGNAITSDIVLTFTTGDNTAPEVDEDATFAVNDDGKIYIYFTEPMNATEMVKKANYLVNGAALGDDDKVSAISDKIVLIDMDDAFTAAPDVLISTNVTDLAGKKFVENALQIEVNDIGAEEFYIDSAVATAKNKIKLTFNKDVAAFNSADIKVMAGSTELDIAALDSVSGATVIMTLEDDLGTDAKVGTTAVTVNTVAAPATTKSVYGTEVDGSDIIDVTDEIAPEVAVTGDDDDADVVVTVDVVTWKAIGTVVAENSTIKINIGFTEVMKSNTFSSLTYTVAGYTVTNVEVAADGLSVEISAIADEDFTTIRPTVTQVYNVTDMEGNVLSGASYESLYTPET